MSNKLKIKPKIIPKPKHITNCDICGNNYTKLEKYLHLKTEMHKHNLHNIPLPISRLKERENYVENKVIKLFKGGALLDEPIKGTKLPEPMVPTKYKPTRPVPKPRKKRPVPLPRVKRVKKKRPLQCLRKSR